MNYQRGFTLVELMIVVGIVAILSAIGLPAYQNYLQRAALTDMLQTMVPHPKAHAYSARPEKRVFLLPGDRAMSQQ